MKLKDRYWTYRKGISTHISKTGNFMTLCFSKMDSQNLSVSEKKDPDCLICISEYKEATGEDLNKKEKQTSLF